MRPTGSSRSTSGAGRQSSALTLTETVEKRFAVACDEVKKRNVTVWVIGFGTVRSIR